MSKILKTVKSVGLKEGKETKGASVDGTEGGPEAKSGKAEAKVPLLQHMYMYDYCS